MSMMGNVHRQVEPRSPHETTQPALRAEENMQTGLRPMPAAREGSGVSPPLVRGGVSAADRRGVLWYARTVGQFVSCVTFGRRTLTIRPGSIQRFSLDSRKNFRIKKGPLPIGSGPHSQITISNSDTRPYSHFPNNEQRRTTIVSDTRPYSRFPNNEQRITTIDSDARPYLRFPNNEQRTTKNDHR